MNYREEKWYAFLKKKYKLSDDQLDEYIDSFEMINKGNDIDMNSICFFLNDLTIDHWNKNDCSKAIKYITKIGSGSENTAIDLKTYLFYIIPICNKQIITKVEIRELFNLIDKKHRGFVTQKEFLKIIYYVNVNPSIEVLDKYKKYFGKMFTQMDKNQDGYIEYEEFKQFLVENDMFKEVLWV